MRQYIPKREEKYDEEINRDTGFIRKYSFGRAARERKLHKKSVAKCPVPEDHHANELPRMSYQR